MNIKQALSYAKASLTANQDAEMAQVDAQYLLSHLFNKNLTWLKTWPEKTLNQSQQKTFEALVARRLKGEPIAYITGSKGFWDLELNTNNSTLIPRSETELLVELAIDFLAHKKQAKVLDLGTGTGAIALSIGSERPHDKIIATDFSAQAIELAKLNAVKNAIQHVEFFQSDWFDAIEIQPFDLIVSNPPYIEENDPHLSQGDLIFEPSSALVAKDNGLADIKKIINISKNYLTQGGCLMLEHGFNQGAAVREIFAEQGYQNIQTVQDLNQLDRISLAVIG